MKGRRWITAVALIATIGTIATVRARFHRDLALAFERSGQNSALLDTRYGPIEVQQAGEGKPLLVVHGSGGGYDQGMDFARPLVPHGIRVIAVSRFGYLRTPRPMDASPEAQADAHVCVLDALGIDRAALPGLSAGAPSALQTAIRHPERAGALVPLVHKPDVVADSAPPASDEKDEWLLRLLDSDFVYWSALRLAPDSLLHRLLAKPPELVHAAGAPERARVNALAEHVLPVSARAAGQRDDKRLKPYLLDSIRAPTLVIGARDDGFGTYANVQYAASRIPYARFIGCERGGQLLVGHGDETSAAIVDWLKSGGR